MTLCAGALAAIVLGGLLVLSGCGRPQPRAETVTTQAFRFQPSSYEWKAGQPVKLTLRNPDAVEHDFVVERFKFSAAGGSGAHASHATSGSAAPTPSPDSLHVHAAAFGEASLTFTPLAAGTYTLVCTIPGHKEAGMVGQVVVK